MAFNHRVRLLVNLRLAFVLGLGVLTGVARAEPDSPGAWTDAPPQLGAAVVQPVSGAQGSTVLPNGRGLPAGAGTAVAGAKVYQRYCLACHGQEAAGGLNVALAGGRGTLDTGKPVKTVGSYWPYATTLFDYVRRAMPYNAPGSLTDEDVYAVTAYLLYVNEIIAQTTVIDARTLPAVQMPNRNGFDWQSQSSQ